MMASSVAAPEGGGDDERGGVQDRFAVDVVHLQHVAESAVGEGGRVGGVRRAEQDACGAGRRTGGVGAEDCANFGCGAGDGAAEPVEEVKGGAGAVGGRDGFGVEVVREGLGEGGHAARGV